MRLIDMISRQAGDAYAKFAQGALPIFVVDNVAEYFYHHDKEYWYLQDFPLAKPSFKSMWVEYRMPTYSRSVEVGTIDFSKALGGARAYFGATASTNGNRIALAGTHFIVEHDRIVYKGELVAMQYEIDEHGEIGRRIAVPNDMAPSNYDELPQEEQDKIKDEVFHKFSCFHPIMLAFSIANSHNVEEVEVVAPPKLQKARIRRGHNPLSRYKIINILPFGSVYKKRTRTVESPTGEGVALHIRRGSFARYGPEYGHGLLFGKYHGMFWRPQALVGKADAGVSVHDYEVKREK